MFFKDTAKPPNNHYGSKRFLLCIFYLFLLLYLFFGWSKNLWIISIDHGFFNFFGEITRQSWALDTLIVQMFRTNTAKIVPLLACIVWLLFERRRQGKSIEFFILLLIGSFLAMTVSRIMQNFSAYRPRPLHNSNIEYQLPFGIEISALEGWSSFPSDTSALAFAIASGIFLASKRLGVVAFLWTIIVVAFPRAYAGLHYPSDLAGGALIGLLCTTGVAPLILHAITQKVKGINDKWMPLLWTLVFLYLFQMGTMFDDVRRYGSFLKEIIGV